LIFLLFGKKGNDVLTKTSTVIDSEQCFDSLTFLVMWPVIAGGGALTEKFVAWWYDKID
jgi:hypothetical protein